MNMPYNEHLLLDFGAMNLAPALMLGVAARTMDRRLLRTALQSALLFWTVHFFIHLRHLHAMSARQRRAADDRPRRHRCPTPRNARRGTASCKAAGGHRGSPRKERNRRRLTRSVAGAWAAV